MSDGNEEQNEGDEWAKIGKKFRKRKITGKKLIEKDSDRLYIANRSKVIDNRLMENKRDQLIDQLIRVYPKNIKIMRIF